MNSASGKEGRPGRVNLRDLTSKKLLRSFYLQPTLTVAKNLLGAMLVKRVGTTLLVGRIVEVEAYLGERDPASHAYRGMTKRNKVMFRTGGHLYVYFTYGMHYCCNVVTEGEGRGRAVLLRAVEPVAGMERMRQNREGRRTGLREIDLTNGPAKLCGAFGIGREQNGADLTGDDIFIVRDNSGTRIPVSRSQRIGITNGREFRWRFFERGNPYVSRTRPGAMS